eukprot:4054192-Amphidinium_carterae.1
MTFFGGVGDVVELWLLIWVALVGSPNGVSSQASSSGLPRSVLQDQQSDATSAQTVCMPCENVIGNLVKPTLQHCCH